MVTRIAFIGTGSIAHNNLRGLIDGRDGVAVVAAVDRDGARVAQYCDQYDIPGNYTNAARMLAAEQPDIVHIATPPDSHAVLAVQALEAGAWVLCEKPIACSLAELDAIQAAEARTGRWCSVVVQRRFGSGGQFLKRLIESGELGDPLVALCNTLWYRDAAYYAVPWRDTVATAGVTFTLGVHAIDMLLWLLGEWDTVQAITATRDRSIAVDNVALAMVRFANGALASMVNSTVSPRQHTLLHIDFQRATVEMPHLYTYTNADFRYTLAPGVSEPTWLAEWQRATDDRPAQIASQWTAFLDSYAHGVRPPAHTGDARATLEFITALYKAGATGETVRRGTIDANDPFFHQVRLALESD